MYTNLGKGGLFVTDESRRSEVRGRTSPYMSQIEHVWSGWDPGEGRGPVKAGRV